MKKIHHDIEFTRLRKKLPHTAGMEEKIALLESIVALNPRNPDNLALRRKYREEMENLKAKRTGKKKTVVSFYDAIHYKRQVTVVGIANSGKSTLINRLAGSEIEVSNLPFTTYRPETQMINCRDVPVMLVEIPAVYEDENDDAKYRFIRNSDSICICAVGKEDAVTVLRQLENNLVVPVDGRVDHEDKTMKKSNETVRVPSFIAARDPEISGLHLPVLDISDTTDVNDMIYSMLNIQRIYSVKEGVIQDKTEVFPADRKVTVLDFINGLDKRLASRMKRVRILHHDESVPDIQSAGMEYELHDGDKVEVVLK